MRERGEGKKEKKFYLEKIFIYMFFLYTILGCMTALVEPQVPIRIPHEINRTDKYSCAGLRIRSDAGMCWFSINGFKNNNSPMHTVTAAHVS